MHLSLIIHSQPIGTNLATRIHSYLHTGLILAQIGSVTYICFPFLWKNLEFVEGEGQPFCLNRLPIHLKWVFSHIHYSTFLP